MKYKILKLSLISLYFSSAYSIEFQSKYNAELRFESRTFSNDKNSKTIDNEVSTYAHFEYKVKSNNLRGELRSFLRVASSDNERSIIVLEDLWLGKTFNNEEINFKIGIQTFNWSVNEVFNPSDVINSKNLESDFENPEKKGELALLIEKRGDDSSIKLMYFPYFTKSIYPSGNSRLGQGFEIGDPIVIDDKSNIRTSSWIPQLGIKFDNTFNSIDFSFHYLNHIDRDIPILSLSTSGLRPNYFRVEQFGFSYQQAIHSLIIKNESVYRNFKNISVNSFSSSKSDVSDHFVTAFGAEFTHVNSNSSETTYLFELQTILGVSEKIRRSLNLFDRDFFVGLKYNFNDFSNKEILIGYIRDISKKNESLSTLSYSQRFSDSWKIKAGARLIISKPTVDKSGLEYFNKDHSIYFNISKFL